MNELDGPELSLCKLLSWPVPGVRSVTRCVCTCTCMVEISRSGVEHVICLGGLL